MPVGFVSLDGIDVREELRVLHWHQLVNARKIIFPTADKFSEEAVYSKQGSEHDVENQLVAGIHNSNIKLDTVQGVDIEAPAPVNSTRMRHHSIMSLHSTQGDDAFLSSCTNKNDRAKSLGSRKSAFWLRNPDDFGTKWAP